MDPAPDLSIGSVFGPYEIKGVLGHGGMGVVYEARQISLERLVALKVIRSELGTDPEIKARFTREAEALTKIDSPHIVQVYDVGVVSGRPFIATQLVRGGDLGGLLESVGALDLRTSVILTQHIAQATLEAHRVGILHRDIKPQNVLLHAGSTPFAYLCDFGIARLAEVNSMTQTNAAIGTVAYMAPERFDGQDASTASDIYSLGCLLWAMLSGSAPYSGTLVSVMQQHEAAPVPQLPATLPGAAQVNRVLSRSLAKRPTDRYATAEEMVTDLDRALVAISQPSAHTMLRTPTPAPPLPPPLPPPLGPDATQAAVRSQPSEPPSRRTRRRWGIVVAALVLLMAALAWPLSAVLGDTDDKDEGRDKVAKGSSKDSAAEIDCDGPGLCVEPPLQGEEALAGDFDADQQPDIGVIAQDEAGAWGVSVSYGGRKADRTMQAPDWTPIAGWSPGSDMAVAADFTGDKLTDVMLVRSESRMTTASLMAGTKHGLAEPRRWSQLGATRAIVSASGGRFDADPRADLALLMRAGDLGSVQVVKSQGMKGGSRSTWGLLDSEVPADSSIIARTFDRGLLADVAILRRTGAAARSVEVMLSQGDRFGDPSPWGTLPKAPLSLAGRDVDADGLADIVAFSATGGRAVITVLSSSGSSFEAPRVWARIPRSKVGIPALFGGNFSNDRSSDVAVLSRSGDGAAEVQVLISETYRFRQPQSWGALSDWYLAP